MPAGSVHLLLFILFCLLLTLLFEIKASVLKKKKGNKPTLIIFNIYETPSDYDSNWNMKPASQ